MEKEYELFATFKHTTDNPELVKKGIEENYSKYPEVKVEFEVVPAEGIGLISGRGTKDSKTVIARVYREKTKNMRR